MLDLELVKKYKKEFDHLVNGGSIWFRYRIIEGSEGNVGMTVWYLSNGVDTEWEENTTDSWSRPYTDLQVVIADKYVEFRKAVYEGRVIQVDKALFYDEDFDGLDSDSSYWVDITTSNPIFGLQPHCYRIKPEEPKFKVGQWISNGNKTEQITEIKYGCWSTKTWTIHPTYKNIDKFSVVDAPKPKFEVGDWVTDTTHNKVGIFQESKVNGNKLVDFGDSYRESGDKVLELWKPTQGEFCVMYNTGTVSKFYTVVRYNYFSEIVERHYSEYGVQYTNVAPIEFLQTIKD